jgi:DNA-binding LacI/PurR family transcriptional regulator
LPSHIPDTKEDQDLLREAINRIPYIVCLEETIYDLPAVMFDRAEAARLVMQHLISLGHKRIAYVGVNDQRVTGYKHSLLEHNLEYDERLIDFIEPAPSPGESSYKIISRLIAERLSFSAIFAATDEAAIGAIAALHDNGLTVPNDVAIASIDNIEMASIVRPALTTVDIPKRTLARLAIQALQTQKNFEDDSQVSVMVPTRLIVRDSCGA